MLLSVKYGSSISGGQDNHTYSIVQQSDIHSTANPLEASQAQSAPNLLQKQAQPHEVLVASTVQCVYTVHPNAAVGSRATTVTVAVMSTCIGVFYNMEAVNSLAIPRSLLKKSNVELYEEEKHRKTSSYDAYSR